jgi:glyoxylase-like metal-dependent hydrolase (beta-lactamase superfamily II)
MTDSPPHITVRLIEYSSAPAYPVSGLLWGRHNAGTVRLPYCFALVEVAGRRCLVDAGYELTGHSKAMNDQIGIDYFATPADALARLGVSRGDIDSVVITHAHWDHLGGVTAFPKATVYIQAEELANYQASRALGPEMHFATFGTDPASADAVLEASAQGRTVALTEPRTQVLPGVTAVAALDTHTPGSQYVMVEAGSGRFVLAGDCVYVYENLGGLDGQDPLVPLGHIEGSTRKTLDLFKRILAEVDDDRRRVIPMHERRIGEHYPTETYDDGVRITTIVAE